MAFISTRNREAPFRHGQVLFLCIVVAKTALQEKTFLKTLLVCDHGEAKDHPQPLKGHEDRPPPTPPSQGGA